MNKFNYAKPIDYFSSHASGSVQNDIIGDESILNITWDELITMPHMESQTTPSLKGYVRKSNSQDVYRMDRIICPPKISS